MDFHLKCGHGAFSDHKLVNDFIGFVSLRLLKLDGLPLTLIGVLSIGDTYFPVDSIF